MTSVPTQVIKCFDSDGGKVPLLYGQVTSGTKVRKDVCATGTRLIEYYCAGTKAAYAVAVCKHGCAKGACLSHPRVE